MTRPFDVCIRGAGIVGRTLALLLGQERLRVGLVGAEVTSTGAADRDVRAYALNARSKALLESLRVWPEPEFATAVRQMEVHGDAGGTVTFNADDQGVDALTWIVDVPVLEARLAQAVRFQPLVERLTEPCDAALTVVCEGKASSAREELGVRNEVTPYPQVAIAGRLRCQIPHAQVARQWFTGGEILAFLPIEGQQGNSVAFVWSVLKERAADLMAQSDGALCKDLEAASGSALGSLEMSGGRGAWPLQLARVDRWIGTKDGKAWALAGDAAHTVHPLAGQGLNLGLEDAAVLTETIRTREYWRNVGDPKLLRRYERARRADVQRTALTMHGLQQLFAQPGTGWQSLRNAGMNGFDRSGVIKKWVARQAMGI
ncbi:FAD-dependent monooxygenase [Rhodoferax sp.]|uniref:FAD-dependent monooxygenase n=1 Tax=Rhodoferax sp. TaxID=50421 RepID=UPI002757BBA1|nr:FAD-dependent monooxygenase [Rhodoferax sp.]